VRIVSWNCGGAFHRKWSHLADLKPDIAIVMECCQPDRVMDLGFTSSEWVGRLHYKGLAVFGFGDWRIEKRPTKESLEWVLPVDVTGPESLTLIAVWAMNHRAKTHPQQFAGMTQPEAMVDACDLGSITSPLVVAGDFNSHPIFDTPRKPSFARTSSRLHDAGLVSLYHATSGEPFGEESTPTHWWRDRTIDGPRYHIDYVWVSESVHAGAQLRVGSYDEWVTQAGSDHAALIVDLDLPTRRLERQLSPERSSTQFSGGAE
jgi:exodeoxyribonuclease-3